MISVLERSRDSFSKVVIVPDSALQTEIQLPLISNRLIQST
jgi:hypothetical protein